MLQATWKKAMQIIPLMKLLEDAIKCGLAKRKLLTRSLKAWLAMIWRESAASRH